MAFEYSEEGEASAVVVRICEVTFAVETWLLSGVEFAQDFCLERFGVPHGDWEPYLTRPDSVYCGWQARLDETSLLVIHMERRIIAF